MATLSNSSAKHVVFSYHKNNQELVLKIYYYLKKENLPLWIDSQDGIIPGNEMISAFVCFMTPMYQASKHYQQEVQSAKNEGIPVIGCRLLPNWKPSGWLNKVTTDILTVDLRGINQRNFEEKINKLREKILCLLDSNMASEIISELSGNEPFTDRSILLDDSRMFSLVENINLTCLKKKPLKYRMLPNKCRLYLSNLMICNNEYILINANNSLHLFDKNLKLVRSNNDKKINENDLKDLSWCSYSNNFIILTRKQVYLMNPLTSKLSVIENMKLKEREEFVSCSCSEEKIFIITCQSNSNSFFLEEYNLPMFRFLKRIRVLDFIGTSLSIQNGFFNRFDIQEIVSVKYYQQKIAIIMQISLKWFIYVFHMYEQPVFLTKIPLEEKSRISILNPINQWIIFKDYLSNSFIQMSMEFQNHSQVNQQYELEEYSKGFIDFNGKLRSVVPFGSSNLVLLIENALVLYKL